MKKETVDQRAVRIAAKIMVADGLCRYDTVAMCKLFTGEIACECCIRSWLLEKARKELRSEGTLRPTQSKERTREYE